ncbi:MAG: ABC transporter permease, partial [Bacteroidota bacterium]
MLKNYFTVAWRTIIRSKLYAAINIAGLAIGLTCFFLIALFIKDELSYDTFHTKAGRIYRVIGILNLEGQGEESSSCPFPVAPALANDYPDLIEQAVRFFNFQDPQHTLRVGDTKMNESRIFMADSNVFAVFDFPLLKGDPAKVLARPNTIVLTQQLASKYFGTDDPISRVIKFDGVTDLEVTGVFGEIPQQSHIHFDALISFSTTRSMMPNQLNNWVWNPNWTYVLLREGIKPGQLEQQLPEFVKKYYPEFLKPQVKHLLQPLTDIHLHSKYQYEIEPNSDLSLIYIFLLIGIFILVIASINFMNLATARSANRAKEVGIRKVSGANKGQLILQFLTESVMISCLAIGMSLLLAELLLPFFNQVSSKNIHISYIEHIDMILLLFASGIGTGIVSGLYPAFYLSSFQPVNVLKGTLSAASRNSFLRRSLVVFQFVISVTLIIATGMVYLQLNHLRSASLGFSKSQVLMLPVRPPMGKLFDPFIAELKGLNSVTNVCRMNDVIGKHHNTHEYNYEGMQAGKWIYYPSLLVDEE